jgi:hypothetical protein
MRTTVTLEPDLAKKVKALAHRRGVSFKQALNEVLRRGLTSPTQAGHRARYQIEPHASGFRTGIDAGKLNQLVDELEVEALVAKVHR